MIIRKILIIHLAINFDLSLNNKLMMMKKSIYPCNSIKMYW